MCVEDMEYMTVIGLANSNFQVNTKWNHWTVLPIVSTSIFVTTVVILHINMLELYGR